MEPELRLSAAEALEHPWLNASWKQGIHAVQLPMASCPRNIQVEDFVLGMCAVMVFSCMMFTSDPEENRKVTFLPKNIFSSRRAENFLVGVVFLVWDFLEKFSGKVS